MKVVEDHHKHFAFNKATTIFYKQIFKMAQFFVSMLSLALLALVNATGYSGSSAPVPAQVNSPIYSYHNVVMKNVASNIQRENIPVIIIESAPVPIKMNFKSASSALNVQQEHANSAPQEFSSDSKDGEIVLRHKVEKPVVQYVNEVITPSRYLTQKVLPVKEYIKTIVSQQVSAPAPAPIMPAPEPTPSEPINEYNY